MLKLHQSYTGRRRNEQRFRGGLVFKAHRLLFHSTLGWSVIQKKREGAPLASEEGTAPPRRMEGR